MPELYKTQLMFVKFAGKPEGMFTHSKKFYGKQLKVVKRDGEEEHFFKKSLFSRKKKISITFPFECVYKEKKSLAIKFFNFFFCSKKYSDEFSFFPIAEDEPTRVYYTSDDPSSEIIQREKYASCKCIYSGLLNTNLLQQFN